MSKTMDNDANKHEINLIELLESANGKLLERIGVVCKEVEERDAEIERLKSLLLGWEDKWDKAWSHENDTLRARVEALESIERISDAKTIERLQADLNLAVAMYDKSRARVEEGERLLAGYAGELNRVRDERDELRTRLAEYEPTSGPRKACPYAIIDTLTAELKRSQTDRDEMVDEVSRLEGLHELSNGANRVLRARLASYENQEIILTKPGNRLGLKTMDEYLRGAEVAMKKQFNEQVELREKRTREVEAENEELKARLASYEKPAPTIVKQTWHSVTKDTVYVANISRERCDYYAEGLERIAVLRRDYYSDGSVKAVLESINQETGK